MRRIIICLGILIAFFPTRLKSQVLNDTSALKLMCRGVDCIYNLQFSEARKIYYTLSDKYPGHPMLYVYRGLITYWENYPLLPDSKNREAFEKDMQYAIQLCEEKTDQRNEAEYLLSNIGAHGLLLLFYADNDMTKDVISVASGTYQYIKQSFKFTNTYADFYFITGLYNYYREAYPEAHPVYKAVAILFPKGNKAQGLKELQLAAVKAIILKAEAYSFLAGIYISFENNFQQAFQYSKSLHQLYPANYQYLAVYIKNLLLVKKYSEAENLLRQYKSVNNGSFFSAQLCILNGILQEKKYNNAKQAQFYYNKGIKDLASFETFGNEFIAYGYFGLSRLSQDKKQKKEYRKHALELADFKNVNFDR